MKLLEDAAPVMSPDLKILPEKSGEDIKKSIPRLSIAGEVSFSKETSEGSDQDNHSESNSISSPATKIDLDNSAIFHEVEELAILARDDGVIV